MKNPKHAFLAFTLLTIVVFSCQKKESETIGKTEITKWQNNKQTAVSLTFDDGSINQFRIALPVLNDLDLKATFFIITGAQSGSEYQAKHLGRPVREIIRETAQTKTDSTNFFERASAIRAIGFDGALDYHTRAGELFESGKTDEAYRLIDEGYRKVREKNYPIVEEITSYREKTDTITWAELKDFASQGHEFASHTISHPRLSVLDEKNMSYELEKSKEEIKNKLGVEHTFSAECPYGTEDERVMKYALDVYPALRNRMPEDFLEELNRGSDKNPTTFSKEYVQWQRGPLSQTPVSLMKSWLDTCLTKDNIWLVLVFHGVEGIGWEAKTIEDLTEFFDYIKSNEDRVWVATFGDVAKYMRERMHSDVFVGRADEDKISISLTHSLDTDIYNLSLTLKTYVPSDWKKVNLNQGDKVQNPEIQTDEDGMFVVYQAVPGNLEIIMAKHH